MDFDCKDLGNIMTNPQVAKKASASPTDVIFATLRDGRIPVSIKAFLDTSTLPKNLLNSIDDKHLDVLGVKYEMKVYEYIISRITKGHYSPNFVPYIGKTECRLGDVVRVFGRDIQTGINREYKNVLQRMDMPEIQNLSIKMLVTGTAGTQWNVPPLKVGSLFDVWERLFEAQQYLVMFQIVYSVAVMQEFGLVHNDMHAGNILVAEFRNPMTLYYVYKRKIFRIVTKFIPYLFDWDLGYSGLLGKNPKIEDPFYCKNRNLCNRFSQKTDLYILFCTLDFKGAIANTYETKENKVSTLAEDETAIPLPSPDFSAEFRRTHTPIAEPNTYKMARGQLNRAFGEEWVVRNMGDVASATFKVYRNNMILHKQFSCRPWSFSASMPSPKEFLDGNYFDRFEAKSLEGADPSVVYRFPSRQTETKETLAMDDRSPVFTDSPYMTSTRGQIAGRGRFPLMGELQTKATFRQLRMAEAKVVLPKGEVPVEQKFRKILYGWVGELQNKYYPTNVQTYFWAIKLIDLYLHQYPAVKGQLQKVAVSAFIVVSGWVSKTPISPNEGANVTADAFSVDEIRDQVDAISRYFKGKLIPTDLQFYKIFESYMDPARRPPLSSIVSYLRKESYKTNYVSRKPSMIAFYAIEDEYPDAMNDRIRQMSRMIY